MRIGIFGAGAWGTALACHAARSRQVRLWARDAAQVEAMRRQRSNERYLPGVRFGDRIEPCADMAKLCNWLNDAPSLAIVATSVAGLRPTLQAMRPFLDPSASCAGILWLCKGLEPDSGLLPHQTAVPLLPGLPGGVLSGPSFAQEVAVGLPVALTVASRDEALQSAAVEAFHHGSARIYYSDDVIGVELGGALKNVMAIAAGICDGLDLGHNARAALITRGLAEITRLGVAMGAQAETFVGLTGLGDLVLTCTGDLSRNRQVGLALARGRTLQDIVAGLGHVAEGVACARAADALATRRRIEMPVVAAVNEVLGGTLAAPEAVDALLAREPRAETG